MGEVYEPCGGCGADHPSKRCINCFHDFGGEQSTHQNKEGLEAAAAAFWMENYGRHRPGKGKWPDDVQGGSQELFRRGAAAAIEAYLATDPLVSSLREENERLRKERDEALVDTVDKAIAWDGANASWQKGYDRGKSAAEAALSSSQAQLKIYREALEKISCPTQTEGLLWWQIDARTALSQEAGE